MARNENQKIKLLKIWDILKNHSDEENPMSTNELIERLTKVDILVERKALYEDIKKLNEFGYEVLSVKKKSNYYYVLDSQFDIAEVKLLMDAVMSAKFLSQSKTVSLSRKVSFLAGKKHSRILNDKLICLSVPKHNNQQIYYSIDSINEAIDKEQKVFFRYFDYNVKKEKDYRKEGKKYKVNPICLAISDGNYYLIAFNDKYKNLSHYRVDKMTEVGISTMPITALDQPLEVDSYQKKVFSMFYGEEVYVSFLVDNSLVGVILDRFGDDVKIYEGYNNDFEIKVKVAISPTFYSWCMTFGSKLKIIEPKHIVEEMQEKIAVVSNLYK